MAAAVMADAVMADDAMSRTTMTMVVGDAHPGVAVGVVCMRVRKMMMPAAMAVTVAGAAMQEAAQNGSKNSAKLRRRRLWIERCNRKRDQTKEERSSKKNRLSRRVIALFVD